MAWSTGSCFVLAQFAHDKLRATAPEPFGLGSLDFVFSSPSGTAIATAPLEGRAYLLYVRNLDVRTPKRAIKSQRNSKELEGEVIWSVPPMPLIQVRITRKVSNFINGVDLSRAQVGDIITVPIRQGQMLIAEGWAVAVGRSATVLVVDDEVSMRSLLTQRFEAQGYCVESVANVDDAIAVLTRSSIDAIVLDVKMPRRSGLDLLRFVRRHEKLRHVPVLILTGVTLSPDEEAIVKANPVYIFYKQENLEEFDIYLDRLTGRSSAHLS